MSCSKNFFLYVLLKYYSMLFIRTELYLASLYIHAKQDFSNEAFIVRVYQIL